MFTFEIDYTDTFVGAYRFVRAGRVVSYGALHPDQASLIVERVQGASPLHHEGLVADNAGDNHIVQFTNAAWTAWTRSRDVSKVR